MPQNKKSDAHTELRRVDRDRAEDEAPASREAAVETDRADQAPGLKPRTPRDRLPGDEDEELFNDVPI